MRRRQHMRYAPTQVAVMHRQVLTPAESNASRDVEGTYSRATRSELSSWARIAGAR